MENSTICAWFSEGESWVQYVGSFTSVSKQCFAFSCAMEVVSRVADRYEFWSSGQVIPSTYQFSCSTATLFQWNGCMILFDQKSSIAWNMDLMWCDMVSCSSPGVKFFRVYLQGPAEKSGRACQTRGGPKRRRFHVVCFSMVVVDGT